MENVKNKRMVVRMAAIGLCSLVTLSVWAQKDEGSGAQTEYYRPTMIGAHSVLVTPDARAAGMGDMGVATTSDNFAHYHNISKLPLNGKQWGVAVSYTPWMTDITKNMGITYATGYFSWGKKMRQSVSLSYKHFNLGETEIYFRNGVDPSKTYPFEMSGDLGYAISFNRHWSVGAAVRYTRSDLNITARSITGITQTVMVDLATTYRTDLEINGRAAQLQAGLVLNNMGGKMSYDDGRTSTFSPALFAIGTGLKMDLAQEHELEIGLQIDKIMAPTLPDPEKEDYEEKKNDLYHLNGFQGIIRSWGDAPGGFAEELKEFSLAIGGEYTYDKLLKARVGFRIEDPKKGNATGFHTGVGAHYKGFNLDLSYFAATKKFNPQNNTLRLTVSASF